MRAALSAARTERQQRLRTLQCLALALFVHTQDQGLLRRVQVEADHIADFIDEERIGGKLAHLGAMGLQAEGLPDPMDGIMREAATLRHRASAPVRRVLRFALQRANDDSLHLRVAQGSGGAPAGSVIQPR